MAASGGTQAGYSMKIGVAVVNFSTQPEALTVLLALSG